jgi:hypothetical protein
VLGDTWLIDLNHRVVTSGVGEKASLMSADVLPIRRAIWYVREHWHLMLLVTPVAFHVLNNWAWLTTNVAILGSDVRRHLMTTLANSDMLWPLSPGKLLDAVIMDEYRPPFFHLCASPLVRLFGRSTDIATMVNTIYMAILLCATYAIGTTMLDRSAGLLEAFVVSTFLMTYGMSRSSTLILR